MIGIILTTIIILTTLYFAWFLAFKLIKLELKTIQKILKKINYRIEKEKKRK